MYPSQTHARDRFKYFADVNGQTVELCRVHYEGRRAIGEPVGSMPVYDHAAGKYARDLITATRVIEFKTNPSRHECDARCMNATGRTMQCECSCGGKNHGRGA